MSLSEQTFGPIRRAATRMRPQAGLVFCAAVLFAGAAYLLDPGLDRFAIILVVLVLACSALWIVAVARVGRMVDGRAAESLGALIAHDAAASIVTGPDGAMIYCNDAAERSYNARQFDTLAAALQSLIANPGALLYRLQSRAGARGSAQEDVVTGTGHLRLSVHQAGQEMLLWRIEKSADLAARRGDAVPLPMLTVGRNNAVLFMNDAARLLIGERTRTLDRICPKLPLRSGQLNDISTQSGVQPCMVVELEGLAGRREVFLVPGIAAPERPMDGWAFFDELPVALLKLSRSGEIRLCNRPASQLLGCGGCMGKPITDLLEGLGRSIPDWLEDAAVARGTVHSEFLRVRRADQDMFIQVTLNPTIEDGETVLIAVLNDATELKTLEAQFVQSQKMQAIGQLAGGVAHDFNNLLTAISGHCDLLLLRHDQGDSDYGDLLQIAQNANRAAALVNQLFGVFPQADIAPRSDGPARCDVGAHPSSQSVGR